MPISVGDRLGPYVVDAFIGSGGMGSVYRAHDPRLGRDVAIKVLAEDLADQADFRRRFEYEIHAISRLNHKNICIIHDSGMFEGQPFIVMELMEGQTLEAKLEEGPLPTVELLNIGIQIADALDAAHGEEIIHRDVKSANIFVTPRGDAKILDFGLAKGQPRTSRRSQSGLTAAGTPVGTAGFMSPEQARGDVVDARSDVFSMGVVLFHMATGLLPFRGSASHAMAQVLAEHPVPPPRSFNQALPIEVDRLIRRALEKDPALRYQTAGDLLAALRGLRRELISGQRVPAPRHDTRAATRRTSLRRAAGLITVGAVLIVMVWQVGPSQGRVDSIAVLPCAPDALESDDAHLCDLLAEGITFNLEAIPEGLEVRSQQTIRPKLNVREEGDVAAGQALEVDAVVTLDLVPVGDSVSLGVAVTDVRDGNLLWGARYSSGSMEEARLGLPEGIASDLTDALGFRLTTTERTALETAEVYRRARALWAQRNASDLEEAIDLLEAVVEMDPTFAEGHAGLASAYVLQPYYTDVDAGTAYRAAQEAAERALDLDPLQAEAHTALGLVLRDYRRDWEGAEAAFQTALRIDQSSGTAHQWYAELLTVTGRFDEAAERISLAIEADPVSLAVRAVEGWILLCAGDDEGAEAALDYTLRRDPDFPLAHWWLGQLLVRRGDLDRAIESLERAVELTGRESSRMLADLGAAYARRGDREQAEAVIEEFDARAEGGAAVSGYEYAIVYTGLGNLTAAYYELRSALRDRTWLALNLDIDPMLDPVREHAEYGSLVEQLSLPEDR